MTDRELLELAAKAAGYHGVEHQNGLGLVAIGQPEKANMLFNPLTSDADAFRLAVACDMTVCADGLATVSARHGYGYEMVMVTQSVCECGNDKSAATRRAIVRAAAAIGEVMP